MHVSNPLRKTGIRARIKLAERVKRLGGVRTTQKVATERRRTSIQHLDETSGGGAVRSGVITQRTVDPSPAVEPVVRPEFIEGTQDRQHVLLLHPGSMSGGASSIPSSS